MAYLEELLPAFRKGVKIRRTGLPKPVNAKGYISYKEGKIYNEFGKECEPDLGLWLSKNDWEVYEEPIDWDCILKKKCLCWFWDGDGSQTINKLQCVGEGEFYDDCCRTWENCRPVRKDEVTFYEDNKDE